MQNIYLDIGNNSKNILPIPYQKSPVPNVESPINYGNSPYPALYKESSRKNDDLQYCNFLEPSPRDQRLNVPYEGNKNCPNFDAKPYLKDSCYLLDSKAQGVVGIVCNEAGGSDNSNYKRGNQFGVDYVDDFNIYSNNKKLEYTLENPVQIPIQLQTPTIKYNNDTFYPEPSFSIRKNKNFLTYPLQQNYTESGIPTYTYPYKTLNPIYNDHQQYIIENFSSNMNSYTNYFYIILIIIIIIILIIIFNKK